MVRECDEEEFVIMRSVLLFSPGHRGDSGEVTLVFSADGLIHGGVREGAA
jgi:hypothetical protein